MTVDSGASVTVIREDMVKAVTAQNARPDIKYYSHLGEKEFSAFSDAGLLRKLKAHVTEVNKSLLSVPRIVKAGNTVVFDSEGSYIEHKASGEWTPPTEKEEVYTIRCGFPRSRCPLSEGRPGKGRKTLERRQSHQRIKLHQEPGSGSRPWWPRRRGSCHLWNDHRREDSQLEGRNSPNEFRRRAPGLEP